MLGLGIDECGEDDIEGVAESVPFIINQDLVHQYGEIFSIEINQQQKIPVVFPEKFAEENAKASCS